MKTTVLILWACLLCWSVTDMAMSGPAPDGRVSIDDLAVAVLTNKTSYVKGEPVFLRLILANRSTANTFEVQGRLHPANDFVIRVALAGGMAERYRGGEEGGVYHPSTTILLPPREVGVQRWTLCYEPTKESGFLFEQAGRYTIECSARELMINGSRQSLTFSKTPIRIAIQEPTGAQKTAFDLIAGAGPKCAEDLQILQDGRVRSDTVALWEQLEKEHPKSLWAPYAQALLAWREWETGERDSTAVARRLAAILDNYPDFPLRDTLYYATAACHHRLGQPVQALDWLYRLQREFPTSHYMRSSLFRKYLYPDGWERSYSPWYLRQ